jgi:uncharacterized radical SAM superfamily Fe-S cluster-containing enzyme
MKCTHLDQSKNVSEGQHISRRTVLRAVPELFVDEHQGYYLLLNPRGPWWFVGSKVVAVFVELCDGKRSIQNIFELMSPHFNGLTPEHLIQIAQSLLSDRFFTEGVRLPIRPLSNVAFNITKRCNLSCPFCYYDSSPTVKKMPDGELDSSEWISLAGKIAEINSSARVYVSGGEPLIRHDIIDILEGRLNA